MAWHGLGWTPAFFSEIEAFPSAVLAHHYGSNMPGEPLAKNGIPNYGDFTTIGAGAGPVDLLVGGTPCQSFSVAGKRLGLDDPRGNLALEYLALARRLNARWFVWENVPGVLSSVTDEEDGEGGVQPGLEGREAGDEWIEESDFATFLQYIQECGYGFAYRVLDAQYVRVDDYPRAVPQRRRRVFVVGYLGDWRCAAAVLLESKGMRGDPPPSRSPSQSVAGAVTASAGRRGGTDDPERGKLVAFGGGNTSGPRDVATALTALTALTAHGQRQDFEVETFIAEIASTLPAGGNSTGGERQPGMGAETAGSMLVAHALRGEGFDASEDGTGRGAPIVPICIHSDALGRSGEAKTASLDAAGALRMRDSGIGIVDDGSSYNLMASGHPHAVAFAENMRGELVESDVDHALQRQGGKPGQGYPAVRQGWAVRRLTPRECERLQGFPDDFTNVPWRNGEATDGPRYKALGNSMAVNVMQWIGERIDIVEKLIRSGRIAA